MSDVIILSEIIVQMKYGPERLVRRVAAALNIDRKVVCRVMREAGRHWHERRDSTS